MKALQDKLANSQVMVVELEKKSAKLDRALDVEKGKTSYLAEKEA